MKYTKLFLFTLFLASSLNAMDTKQDEKSLGGGGYKL